MSIRKVIVMPRHRPKSKVETVGHRKPVLVERVDVRTHHVSEDGQQSHGNVTVGIIRNPDGRV